MKAVYLFSFRSELFLTAWTADFTDEFIELLLAEKVTVFACLEYIARHGCDGWLSDLAG